MVRIPEADSLSDAPYTGGRQPLTYSGRDLAGLQAPGRGLAKIGQEVQELGVAVAGREKKDRSDSELAGAELEAQTRLLALERDLEKDPDHAKHRERWEDGTGRIGQESADKITDPHLKALFERRFEMDRAKGALRVDSRVTRMDVDQQRARLGGLLEDLRKRYADPTLTDEDRDSIYEQARDAITRLAAKPQYLSAQTADKLLRSFEDQSATDEIIALTQAGRFDEARARLGRDGRRLKLDKKRNPENQDAIVRVAQRLGMDPITLLAISDIETNGTLSTSSGNKLSSAYGLYHFLTENRKWAEKVGVPYGDDPESQTRAMIAKMRSDKAIFRRAAGRDPQPWEEYILHFQGGPTGTRLLTADPETPLDQALGPRAAAILRANPNLQKYETVGDMLADYQMIFENRMRAFSDGPGVPRRGLKHETQRRALLDRINASERRVHAQEGAEIDLRMKDDLLSIERTGQPITDIDVTRATRILGEKRVGAWQAQRSYALEKYRAVGDMHELSPQDIQARLQELEPKAGQPGYKRREEVYKLAVKTAQQIEKLRREDPALAVERFSDVKRAQDAVTTRPSPETWKALMAARLKAQAIAGVPEVLRQPLTKSEADTILAPVAQLSTAAKYNPALAKEIPAMFADIVKKVSSQYGDMGGIVIRQALQGWTRSQETAEMLTGLFQKYAREGTVSRNDMQTILKLREIEDAETAIDWEGTRTPQRIVPGAPRRPKGRGPLSVPPPSATAPRETPAEQPAPPPAHIQFLRKHPGTAADFDAKYGKGAAARYLSE